MYRANLYLYPHTHHSKTSTVPGAYPSAVIKGHNSTDFMRTIQLTVENPVQPIGRSSRNEAKGLFAARDNGFFESPVMSRSHAEVKITLEPRRKITIQDTNSMHGTFVNGLQLHSAETAELQQGTEVTFGAEVTRGDEVFPAKTFRCEVEWERLRSPSPRPHKLSADSEPRTGYGLSSEDLIVSEYDSNEDDEFDEDVMNQSDHNDERMTSSSGRSSPAASECSSTDPEASTISGSCWRLSDDNLGNKEPSNKNPSEYADRTVSEPSSHDTKLPYDDLESDSVIVSERLRQRMPTIHSLVHKTQADRLGSARTPSKTPWTTNITDHLLEVEKTSCSSTDTLKEALTNHPKTKEGNQQETVQSMIDFDAGAKNSTNDIENNNIQKMEAISSDKFVEAQSHDQAQTSEIDNILGVDVATPPPVATNSKICGAGWAGIPNAAPSLPPLKKVSPPVSTVRTYAGGSHTHWSTAEQSSMNAFMDSKREFFDARAKNFAKVRELDVDPTHTLFPSPPALSHFSPWSEWSVKPQPGNLAVPDSKPRDNKLNQQLKCRLQAIPSKKPGFLSVKIHRKQKGVAKQDEDESMGGSNQEDDNQDVDNSYEMTESGGEDVCNDSNFDDDEDYGDYYEDPGSEDDNMDTTIESQHMMVDDTGLNTTNTDSQTGENTKSGYSKFSIDDMMNHESPAISRNQAETTGNVLPKNNSTAAFDILDKSKVGTALQDLLNPTALLTPPPTLKRKRSYASHNEQFSSPTPQSLYGLQVHELSNDSTVQDAPEVVNSNVVADYPELAAEPGQTNITEYDEERSRKRVKVQNNGGNNLLRLVTATLAGAVVGGVGVFAALVATAQ